MRAAWSAPAHTSCSSRSWLAASRNGGCARVCSDSTAARKRAAGAASRRADSRSNPAPARASAVPAPVNRLP